MNDSKSKQFMNPFLMINSQSECKQNHQRQSMINSSRFSNTYNNNFKAQRRCPIFTQTPQRKSKQSRQNSNRRKIFNTSEQKQKERYINKQQQYSQKINKLYPVQKISTDSDEQQIAKQNKVSNIIGKNKIERKQQIICINEKFQYMNINKIQQNRNKRIINGQNQQQWKSQLDMVRKKLFVQTPQRKVSPQSKDQLLNQRQFLQSSRKNKLYQKQSYQIKNHLLNQFHKQSQIDHDNQINQYAHNNHIKDFAHNNQINKFVQKNQPVDKTKVKYNNKLQHQEQQYQDKKSQYFISKIKNFITNRKQQQLQQKTQPFTFRQTYNKNKINHLYKFSEQQKKYKNNQNKIKSELQTIKPNDFHYSRSINNKQTQSIPIKKIADSLRQLHRKMLQKSKICQKVNQQNLQLKHQNHQLKQLNNRLKQEYLNNINNNNINKSYSIKQNERNSDRSLYTHKPVNQKDHLIIQKQNIQYKKKIFRAKTIIKNLLLLGQDQENNNSILNIKRSLEESLKVLQI